MIFVFGSNEKGIHGAGAAKHARIVHGAQLGVAFGPTGNAFAIPTKDSNIENTLSLERISMYVAGFIHYARLHPSKRFQVTRIGCGLAGLNDEDVAWLFINAPSNCYFDSKWGGFLGHDRIWGTFPK